MNCLPKGVGLDLLLFTRCSHGCNAPARGRRLWERASCPSVSSASRRCPRAEDLRARTSSPAAQGHAAHLPTRPAGTAENLVVAMGPFVLVQAHRTQLGHFARRALTDRRALRAVARMGTTTGTRRSAAYAPRSPLLRIAMTSVARSHRTRAVCGDAAPCPSLARVRRLGRLATTTPSNLEARHHSGGSTAMVTAAKWPKSSRRDVL
jgi:hypothetical protein